MKVFKKIISSMKIDSVNNKTTPESLIEETGKIEISKSIQKNEETFKQIFLNSFDFYQERVCVGAQEGIILYLKSMVDMSKISDSIQTTLVKSKEDSRTINTKAEVKEFQKEYFSSYDVTNIQYEHEVVWHVLSGFSVLLIGGISEGVAILTTSSEARGVEQSQTQTIIRGPQDSFTESKITNLSLIRRRVKNPHLKSEKFKVGKDTQTDVCMVYLDHVASKDIVDEMRNRIENVTANAIIDSGNLEELICDKVLTPFPMVYHTDRPDSVSAEILEGKVGVIVDGSPFVLVAPVVFTNFFQVSEDYYQGFMMATLLRLLRFLAFLLALLLPSMYIGLTTYHHQLIPTELLISIQAQREGVPFPAVIELLLMEVTFEILREAGVRMPRVVGQTVSIVGALVIGQAAVEAGVVSHFLVIIVALTAMAGFVSPVYSFANATRILRFGLIFLTAVLGLFGTLLGFLMIIAHLTHIRSFGVPYLAPMGPFILEDQKDVMIRLPIQMMKRRPNYLHPKTDLKQAPSDPLPSTKKKEESS